MKQFLRHQAYCLLTGKRISEDALAVCEIRLERDEISFFHLSTNQILSLEQDGMLWYFRECPRILTGEAYWERAIRDFFDSLDRLRISRQHFSQSIPIRLNFEQEEIRTFQEYITGRWNSGGFCAALGKIDRTAEKCGFSIWAEQTYDRAFFERFALHELPVCCWDIGVYFLWSMRAAAGSCRMQGIVRGERHSFFHASRAAASQIVAEELGLAHLITPSKWCRIFVGDEEKYFGILSASAPGRRMLDQVPELAGSLQKELTNLNLLDVICFQPDHGPNNYNAAVDTQGHWSVCAFDNDNALTFFPMFSVGDALAGCTPFVNRKGCISRPHLDESTARNLEQVNIKRLKSRLKPYLNSLQIAAVIGRLHALQKAVDSTRACDRGFLIGEDGWNEQTAAEELCGAYGRTYLTVCAKDPS